MKVLLTGAAGFIGSYVLKSLMKQNVDVVALGRKKPQALKKTQFIEADLLTTQNYDHLFAEHKFTHMLHLAWYAEHGKYWTSPLNLRWVETTVKLVEAFCKTGGAHITIAGTCAEYDWSYGFCHEDLTPLKPLKLYGVAKDATRKLVFETCSGYQIPCSWGRIFLPYGVGESSQRLLPSLIDVFQGRRKPFGVNVSAYRDFLHASDVAEGFVTLVKKNADGVFNISSGVPLRLTDLIKKLANILNADPEMVLDLATERPNEPPLLLGDNSKLRSVGWDQKTDLHTGLKQSIEL